MTPPTDTLAEPLPPAAEPLPARVGVAIVGSGFSGLAMAQRLVADGVEDFLVLERGHDVGGTWRDNSYPGCACDVPSHLYSLSFAPNPGWSSTFSPQPEIQAYLQRTAAEHGLTQRVRFGCEVERARWDDDAQHWVLETSHGTLEAGALVAAAGPLSEPRLPDVPGLDRFEGTVFHSASWDHAHDLRGERVAVVGTGASAIQFVPEIQPDVAGLHLFQRTPPWVMPRRARPITRYERLLYTHVPLAQRLMRDGIYWAREAFVVPMLRARLAPVIRAIAMRHLRSQVGDPGLRAKLTPDYLPGCKRILISNDYLRSLTKENVEVITEGVAEVREHSVLGADGTEREVDTIIFGTGFHVTDLPIADRITGRGGVTLGEQWEGSPQAHRGTTIPGFPNLFILLGPNTGLGHNSVVVMAEAQADYVMGALRHLRSVGGAALEPTRAAWEKSNEALQAAMKGTVWTEGGCASWYIDAKGRNTTLWPSFSAAFRRRMRRFDAEHYTVHAPQRERQTTIA